MTLLLVPYEPIVRKMRGQMQTDSPQRLELLFVKLCDRQGHLVLAYTIGGASGQFVTFLESRN